MFGKKKDNKPEIEIVKESTGYRDRTGDMIDNGATVTWTNDKGTVLTGTITKFNNIWYIVWNSRDHTQLAAINHEVDLSK